MTIDKAIEILTFLIREKSDTISSDENDAVKLGIQALERTKIQRARGVSAQKGPLPDETSA